MNESFVLKRQLLLIDKFWFDNRKQIFYLLAVTISLLLLWLNIYLSFRNPILFAPKFQVAYYFFGLSVSGALVANFSFAELREKPKAINFLLVPASALEKLVVGFLFSVIIYGLLYSASFYIVNSIMVHLANQLLASDWEVINIFNLQTIEDPFFDNRQANQLFILYLTMQAFFVCGGLYFSKFSFFKTALIFLGIWLTRLLLPNIFLFLLPTGNFQQVLTSFEVIDVTGNKIIEMPMWFSWSFDLWYSLAVVPLLWLVSYFKLKEKQIA